MTKKKSNEARKRYETVVNEQGEVETKFKTEVNDKGEVIFKEKSKIKSGKHARAAGGRFELKVRKHWEDNGYVIAKWSNNVDLEIKKLIPAKRKFNPFSKALTLGTGFPDFLVFQQSENGRYDVFGVEVKMNGILSKEEKEKCMWYLDNKVFSKIIVAKKGDGRGEIENMDFMERWGTKMIENKSGDEEK